MNDTQNLTPEPGGRGFLIFLVVVLIIGTLIWHVPPFNRYTRPEYLKALFAVIENRHYFWAVVIGMYVVAGLIMFPITVLTTVIALLVGIEKGLLLALTGCTLSAAVTFVLVRIAGERTKNYLKSKKRIQKINRLITEEGISSIMILRMVPIGYTVVSVTAALSDIKFIPYMIGSIIGVLPDLILCIILAGSIHNIILGEGNRYIYLIVGVGIVFIALWSFLVKKFVSKLKNMKEE